MELAQEQRSARAQYQAILDQLNARGVDAQTCKGGLWFTDVRSMQKEGIGLLEEKLGVAGEDVKQVCASSDQCQQSGLFYRKRRKTSSESRKKTFCRKCFWKR